MIIIYVYASMTKYVLINSIIKYFQRFIDNSSAQRLIFTGFPMKNARM